jgi:uncharacterized protein YabE (DUF348 family)
LFHRLAAGFVLPGIYEVWSLVSGTRSNPPHHHPAYGADYAQDGYYAVNELSGVQQGLAAPYAAGEGTSEVAEYYYEDQYDQQQAQYQYGDYDEYGRYAESSTPAGYDPEASYAPRQGGYEDQGGAGYPADHQGPGYPQDYGQGYQEYPAPPSGEGSGYPADPYAADPYRSEAAPAPGYQPGGYEPEYAPSHRARHGSAGATDVLVADPAVETLVEPEEPFLDPADAPPEPATLPGPRRARPGERPARTKADGSGRPPVLRTRPRTGPLGRVVQGVVLAALIGGATAYVAYDKTITISIDGQTQTVHSFASTVGAVLTADGVDTGSKDIVSPAPSAGASSGQTITVRYGRPLNLSVDGVARQAWVHYPTVAAALQELGVRTAGARSSAPLSTTIPRSGLSGLVVYTMRHVTFLVDGKTVPIDTTAATVTAAMQQAGIVLHNQDAPSVPAGSMPADGETISINRIFGSTETKEVSIPYQTTQVNDPNAYTGTTSVTTQGVDGEETVTYALLTINGKTQPPKQVSESVTRQPVNEVVSVGTKALPSSASDLDWSALANCESGGNPSEDTGNGFYGMYQFTVSTWDSLGGSGLPSDASSATQTALAEKLYNEAGAGQWPVCGHLLFS